MLIEIHIIQNHSPANLNRDDLGAPKTCYFGGVLRSRVSSQCIKRSIRLSEPFKKLLGGVRTRQLARLITERLEGKADTKKRALKVLDKCGIKSKDDEKSDMLVYTTHDAIDAMAQVLSDSALSDDDVVERFKELISQRTAVPDMALSGRMLETGEIDNTTVEAALQVAHAISTHEARPEVDYYVAADDIPGTDAGAGYVDEAIFSSACFYKYFSIHWEQLVANLRGNEKLAAHTIGAFLRAAVETTPTGKQNSYAAHNRPDLVLIEFKNTPASYANAFAAPIDGRDARGLVGASIAALVHYAGCIDRGYGAPDTRFVFSPGGLHKLDGLANAQTIECLDELIASVVRTIGHDWATVQSEVVNTGAR